jgi:hypothetical protein
MNPAELYESSDGIGVATAAPAAAPTHSAARAARMAWGTNLDITWAIDAEVCASSISVARDQGGLQGSQELAHSR